MTMSRRAARLFVLLGLLVLLARTAQAADRPNVVLLMADDLGLGRYRLQRPPGPPGRRTSTRWPGEPASSTASTPAPPVCSPTRGSCLTGRHPYRYGVATANAGHLKAGERLPGRGARRPGYATGHFGKWHLGTLSPDYSGKGKGREPAENLHDAGHGGFGTLVQHRVRRGDLGSRTTRPTPTSAATSPATRPLLARRPELVDGPAEGLVGGDSRIIMDKALPFIEGAVEAGKPFFAVIWFHAPHMPVVGGPEYLATVSRPARGQRHYYACITALDEQVGRLRSTLRDARRGATTRCSGSARTTARRATPALGALSGHGRALPGRKRSLYEGGMRVPGLLEWPSADHRAARDGRPGVTSDYLPTILDVLASSRPTITTTTASASCP